MLVLRISYNSQKAFKICHKMKSFRTQLTLMLIVCLANFSHL